MKNMMIRKMAGIAMLIALEVILQFVGNYITIGTVSINLSLMPIAMAAILYGPVAGLVLGVVNGAMVLLNAQAFLAVSWYWTVIICLTKTGLAGLVSGLLFKLFKGKGMIPGIFVCSLIVPIINTGIFALGAISVLRPWLDGVCQALENPDVGYVLLIVVIGINFLFELGVEIFLTPVLIYLLKIITKRYDIGDNIGDALFAKAKEPIKNNDEMEGEEF